MGERSDVTPAQPSNDNHALDPEWLRSRVENRRILIGITGGIAVYKVCTLVSRLAQAGANVTVLMTESATRFVTPLTFEALSGNAVYTSAWQPAQSHDPQHIALADSADVALVAPCTMDFMGSLATGRTDSVVSLVLSAIDRSKTPVLLAPSMNEVMWNQPATRRNAEQLGQDGFSVVAPGMGWQACRHVGTGRMAEPEDLAKAVVGALDR
ncbi:MAG: phosphopantothenoylcysteine decarboxylase/phosphopantothenate--cysteine ligase [Phycisphaerales bacterium]|jgi:phosphopantothenoylcysteine decarboxylase/phosphopantothenate--cysteine ligase